MPRRLPSAKESLNRLVGSGEQLTWKERDWKLLPGFRLKGERLQFDRRVLGLRGSTLYVEPEVRDTLERRYGIESQPLGGAVDFLRGVYGAEGFVLGVSGLTKIGYSYAAEAVGLDRLLVGLAAHRRKPALVTDGGESRGVLGLSAVKAAQHRIGTLGFVPRQGLPHVGPRTHTVICMETYQERERLVGLAPDLLVCFGGDEDTLRELEIALDMGSVAMIVLLKPDVPLADLWQQSQSAQAAYRQRRLFVCRTFEDIQDWLPHVIPAVRGYSLKYRRQRLAVLSQFMLGA